jgi:transcriptional regulator with XRE-family HTH domain
VSDAFQSSPVVFGQRLRQARMVLGLPQDKLGVKAGLDESSASARMSRYESGLHMPDLPFAQRLAFELNVPDAYLFAADNTLADLILCYGKLTTAKRHALLAHATNLCE